MKSRSADHSLTLGWKRVRQEHLEIVEQRGGHFEVVRHLVIGRVTGGEIREGAAGVEHGAQPGDGGERNDISGRMPPPPVTVRPVSVWNSECALGCAVAAPSSNFEASSGF